MKIGTRDTEATPYVIAEIGGNHNGDPEVAYRLVEAAANAGADAVKFQTYRAETLVHPSVQPVPLVKKHYATQLDRFKSLELSWEVYERLFGLCTEHGIDFITTPFDLEILKRTAPHMPAIKIASGDLTFHQLVSAAADTGKPVILSTGMSTLEEVARAAALIPAGQRVLLHCVSIYPLPDDQANLRAIPTMIDAFPDAVIGYSDHSIGVEACLAAVALGARVLEKHFTLDRSQVPGDHVLSLEPDQLAGMVEQVRRVAAMRGTPDKNPADGEAVMREQMRRGVYSARALPAGHRLTEADMTIIRPRNGVEPEMAEEWVGRRLKSALEPLQPIGPDRLEAD